MSIIGITGTGSLVGQAIIKSIKSSKFKNDKLIGFDYFKGTIGSYWVDKNYLLPDILDKSIDVRDWLYTVMSVIKRESIEILFIGVDFELIFFAEHKEMLERETNCVIVVSDKKTIEIADDKYLTYQFLKDNNLYFPYSYLEDEIDNAIENGEISFPVILKPRNGFRSVNVFLIKNEEELREKLPLVDNPVVQEHVGNRDSEYSCGTIAFNGDVKKSIVLRRDLKDGNTSTTYLNNSFPSIIKDYIEDISRKLGQFGVCNYQLRIGVDGIPKLFEINSRHSGTTYIRSLYGFNEIEYILEYLLNGKEIEFSIKEGTVKRFFDEFFVEA